MVIDCGILPGPNGSETIGIPVDVSVDKQKICIYLLNYSLTVCACKYI